MDKVPSVTHNFHLKMPILHYKPFLTGGKGNKEYKLKEREISLYQFLLILHGRDLRKRSLDMNNIVPNLRSSSENYENKFLYFVQRIQLFTAVIHIISKNKRTTLDDTPYGFMTKDLLNYLAGKIFSYDGKKDELNVPLNFLVKYLHKAAISYYSEIILKTLKTRDKSYVGLIHQDLIIKNILKKCLPELTSDDIKKTDSSMMMNFMGLLSAFAKPTSQLNLSFFRDFDKAYDQKYRLARGKDFQPSNLYIQVLNYIREVGMYYALLLCFQPYSGLSPDDYLNWVSCSFEYSFKYENITENSLDVIVPISNSPDFIYMVVSPLDISDNYVNHVISLLNQMDLFCANRLRYMYYLHLHTSNKSPFSVDSVDSKDTKKSKTKSKK